MRLTPQREAIDLALAAGDVSSAAKLAAAAVAGGSAEPMLLNLTAWIHEEAGDFGAARALLTRAQRIAPRDATIISALGRIERLSGNHSAALRWLDAASALDPDFAVPWLERGFAFDSAGETVAARAAYLRAAALDPGLAIAWAGAASVAAREGDAAAVREFSDRALALDPAQAVAHNALAANDIENGNTAAAAGRLRALLGRTSATPEDRIAALTLLGDALDKDGAAADAFAAWSAAKASFAAFHAPRFGGLEPQRTFIDRLAKRVAAIDSKRWHTRIVRAEHRPALGHVFLLGYPRSGTTLVENILAGAPGVVALEERPTLADSDVYLLDEDGIDRLLAADAPEIDRLRNAYWTRVSALGINPVDRIVVDMNPMNGMKLPLIARLFPEARIVIMRRDPRDVVLSCFRQNFRVSAPALAFSSLDEAARHYAATMALTELCLAAMPLARHVVRYDALVADFESVTRELCAFTNVDWSPELRRFDRVAQTRGVTTASAPQVRRGLFDGGGRWRRYVDQLAPILPILAPWVERFEFAA